MDKTYMRNRQGNGVEDTLTANVFGRKDCNLITLHGDAITANQNFLLIDSDNKSGKWPHRSSTPMIDVRFFAIDIAVAANVVADVQMGYLSNVTKTRGTFNMFHAWHIISQIVPTYLNQVYQFNDLKIGGVYLPRFSNNTEFGSNNALQDPQGNAVNLGNGDHIMRIITTGALSFTATEYYNACDTARGLCD